MSSISSSMSRQASDGSSSTGGKLAKMLGSLGAAWSKTTSTASKTSSGAPSPKPGDQSTPSQASMPSSPTAAPAAAAGVQRASDDMEADDQVFVMPGPSLTPQQRQDILDKAAAEGLPLVVPPGYNQSVIVPRDPPARQGSIEKLMGAMCLSPWRDDLTLEVATQPSQEAAISSGSGGRPKPGSPQRTTSRQGAAEGPGGGQDGSAVKRGLLARLADAVGTPAKVSA